MKNDAIELVPCRLSRDRMALYFAGVATLAIQFTACSSPGYLAVLGPAPFRFAAIANPSTNRIIFHLPKPEPVLPAKTNAVVLPQPLQPQPAVAPIAAVPTNNPPEQLAPLPAVETAPQDPVVSPQMLLRFFNKSTNGASSSLVAPLDFNPPRVAAPQQSSATYSTTP